MLSMERRSRLLEVLNRVRWKGRYARIVRLLEPLPEEEFLEEPELGFYFAGALSRVGRNDPVLPLLRRLISRFPPGANDRLVRKLLYALATAYYFRGELDEAQGLLSRILELACEADDQLLTGNAAMLLGVIADIRGERDDALAHYLRGMAAAQLTGDEEFIAHLHHNVGMTYRELGFFAAAETHLADAIEIMHRQGRAKTAAPEMERAVLLSRKGDRALAEATARRALRTARAAGNQREIGEAHRVLGMILSEHRPAEAEACLLDALRDADATGTRLLQAEIREELAVLYARCGRTPEAVVVAGDSMELYWKLGAPRRVTAVERRMEALRGAPVAS